MVVMYELKCPQHYKPNMLNLSKPGDHHAFRPVLRQGVRRWLISTGFPYSLTITHSETADADLPKWSFEWFEHWQRTIRCYIEFDDPGHLLLFKLTWG